MAHRTLAGRPVAATGLLTLRPCRPAPCWHDEVACSRLQSHHEASSSVHRSRREDHSMRVSCALFDPPPFSPTKVSVRLLPGAATTTAGTRCYTLTHNDLTGQLNLSVGSEYNQQQLAGWYTRLVRDEVLGEWCFGAAPVLHVYCHVSGAQRWLAPPQLRSFIFRREMSLVLDTFVYGDSALLVARPELSRARVFVHFCSDEEALNTVEEWGLLGQRSTWGRVSKTIGQTLWDLMLVAPPTGEAAGDTEAAGLANVAVTTMTCLEEQDERGEAGSSSPCLDVLAPELGQGPAPSAAQSSRTVAALEHLLQLEKAVEVLK